MTETARWKATVYVGGLGPQVTVANVHDAFVPFGDIADISLPKNDRNRLNGRSGRTNGENEESTAADLEPGGHRGFAYVEYEDADDAKEAIDNMDKSELFGRSIKVTAAKPPKAANEGLGSKTALWNQEAWIAQNSAAEDGQTAPETEAGDGQQPGEDPMEGLEGLDVAGPRQQ